MWDIEIVEFKTLLSYPLCFSRHRSYAAAAAIATAPYAFSELCCSFGDYLTLMQIDFCLPLSLLFVIAIQEIKFFVNFK